MRVLTSARANSVCIIALASALLGVGQAAAQQPSQDQIAAIKSNCRSDYMSYCSSVPRGGSQALQCLKSNVAKLSSGCQQAVKAATASATPPSGGGTPASGKPAAEAKPAVPTESTPPASAATQVPPSAASSLATTQPATPTSPTSGSSASASPAADATAKPASPAKSSKKSASTSAKAAAQPSPAAGATGTAPASASVKKPAAAVAAAPAQPAPTTAAVPPAVSPQLGFIPPRKKIMLARACRDDFRAYCPGVDVGGGRAITCLSENISKLTPGCRDTLARLAR